jgi:hypothetical protein
MRRLPRGLLVIGSAFLVTLTGLGHTPAQKPSAVPVDLEIPAPPKKLLAEGGWRPQPTHTTNRRRLEISVENAVVRFP